MDVTYIRNLTPFFPIESKKFLTRSLCFCLNIIYQVYKLQNFNTDNFFLWLDDTTFSTIHETYSNCCFHCIYETVGFKIDKKLNIAYGTFKDFIPHINAYLNLIN
jgi:hypothetical protein